jgi:hypothetical protein
MSFNPHDNSKDLRYLIVVLGILAMVFILGITVNNVTSNKLNASLIRHAIDQKADLAAVRCLMDSQYVRAGCDTVSLVKELRTERTPATPSVIEPVIQP